MDDQMMQPTRQSSEVQTVMTEQKAKKAKLWRTILFALLVILALVSIVAAVLFVAAEKDKESPAMAEAFLQAVIDGDSAAAYDLMYPGLQSEEDFEEGFQQVCAIWETYGGGEAFTLERTGWHLESRNKIRQWTVEYTVKSGEAEFRFLLKRAEQESLSGMVGANLSVEARPVEK